MEIHYDKIGGVGKRYGENILEAPTSLAKASQPFLAYVDFFWATARHIGSSSPLRALVFAVPGKTDQQVNVLL